jgi:hypothetical protein
MVIGLAIRTETEFANLIGLVQIATQKPFHLKSIQNVQTIYWPMEAATMVVLALTRAVVALLDLQVHKLTFTQ